MTPGRQIAKELPPVKKTDDPLDLFTFAARHLKNRAFGILDENGIFLEILADYISLSDLAKTLPGKSLTDFMTEPSEKKEALDNIKETIGTGTPVFAVRKYRLPRTNCPEDSPGKYVELTVLVIVFRLDKNRVLWCCTAQKEDKNRNHFLAAFRA